MTTADGLSPPPARPESVQARPRRAPRPARRRAQHGQAAIEYALILTLIGMIAAGTLVKVGNLVAADFAKVSTALGLGGPPPVVITPGGAVTPAQSGPPCAVCMIWPNGAELTLASGAGVVLNSGSITDDSNAVNAIYGGAGSTVTVNNGGALNMVPGGGNNAGQATLSPGATVGAASVDPLAGMAAPVATVVRASPTSTSSSTITMNPGIYTAGVTLGSSDTITMNPGLYVFESWFQTGSGTTFTGSGVTIYMTCPSYGTGSGGTRCNSADGQVAGSFTFSSSNTVTLSAPTSGPTAGMLFWYDNLDWGGLYIDSAATSLTGTIYQPEGMIVFTAASSATWVGGIVTSYINLASNTVLTDNYNCQTNPDCQRLY